MTEQQLQQPVTCMGCVDYQPNQLAHMFPGGCLYMDEELEQVEPNPQQKIGEAQPTTDVQDASSGQVCLLQQEPTSLQESSSVGHGK